MKWQEWVKWLLVAVIGGIVAGLISALFDIPKDKTRETEEDDSEHGHDHW